VGAGCTGSGAGWIWAVGAGWSVGAAGSSCVSGIASPAWPIQATTVFTGTVVPSGTRMRSSTPSSKVSISMFDLSVSISNRTSPLWTGSPSRLSHAISVHSSVIWPGRGMRIGVAIR
jgi:hypothetical protein